MSLKAKTARIARLAVIAGVITAAATLGLSGTANAAYSSPPASTTDWFGLDLVNDPGNIHFEVCDYQSTSQRIYVSATDVDLSARVMMADDRTNNETYGEWVNFNPGGCEGWWLMNFPIGDPLEGDINTPSNHSTGTVRYN